MNLKAVIVEDEYLAAKRLERMIQEVAPDIKVVATLESIADTLMYFKKHEMPDVLFLDVHLSDGNSFELFNQLDILSKIVFTTAYDAYAVEAFRKNATDYLLKPISKEELIRAIEKLTPIDQGVASDQTIHQRILVRFANKLHSIKVADIAYIFSKNKVSYIVTKDGHKYPSDQILQEYEDMLDANFFFRANRQYLIHIESINQIVRHDASRVKLELLPPTHEEIVVSTEKTRVFKAWLDR